MIETRPKQHKTICRALILLLLPGLALACAEEQTIEQGQVVVEGVKVQGDESARTFSVTLASDDTGCAQYADWWEITNEAGDALLYRRILAHSHIDEQPFTRSGGPLALPSSQRVVIRGHMHPGGYGRQALIGSIDEGFKTITLAPDFGEALAQQTPQPSDCSF